MMDLIGQARKYEQDGRWDKFPECVNFFHNLQLGVVLSKMTLDITCLKPEVVRTAEYLRGIFKILSNEVRREGKAKCWHFRRRRYRQFVFNIAQLAGRLKQAAS